MVNDALTVPGVPTDLIDTLNAWEPLGQSQGSLRDEYVSYVGDSAGSALDREGVPSTLLRAVSSSPPILSRFCCASTRRVSSGFSSAATSRLRTFQLPRRPSARPVRKAASPTSARSAPSSMSTDTLWATASPSAPFIGTSASARSRGQTLPRPPARKARKLRGGT